MCRNLDLIFRTLLMREQCQTKVEPDVYGLPKDGQTAEEHVCVGTSSYLMTLPFDCAQYTVLRTLLVEQGEMKMEPSMGDSTHPA